MEAHSEDTQRLWNHFKDQYAAKEAKNTKTVRQPNQVNSGGFLLSWLKEFSLITRTRHITPHQTLCLLSSLLLQLSIIFG